MPSHTPSSSSSSTAHWAFIDDMDVLVEDNAWDTVWACLETEGFCAQTWHGFFQHVLGLVLQNIKNQLSAHPSFFKPSDFLYHLESCTRDDAHYALSVLLTGNDKIQQLNKDFRQKDAPTNVLSFPGLDMNVPSHAISSDDAIFLGDLAFSYAIIKKECYECSKKLSHHMIHLTIHGILHLFGFDHGTDEEAAIMEHMETNILQQLGIQNPYL